MPKSAIARVNWDTYHSPPEEVKDTIDRYGPVRFYGSTRSQLVSRVADGGTLWLVTRRPNKTRLPIYCIAYKILNCSQVDSHWSKYRYMVAGKGRDSWVHFPHNDATDVILDLHFNPEKKSTSAIAIANRVSNIPMLTDKDSELLDKFQYKVFNSKMVFFSYSHSDENSAFIIETELKKRAISVTRDRSLLLPGDPHQEKLLAEAASSDCFIVLVSRAAATSPFVQAEVQQAIDQHGRLVKKIVPIVLSPDGWDGFPKLHEFQTWSYNGQLATDADFDKLAQGIRLATAPAR